MKGPPIHRHSVWTEAVPVWSPKDGEVVAVQMLVQGDILDCEFGAFYAQLGQLYELRCRSCTTGEGLEQRATASGARTSRKKKRTDLLILCQVQIAQITPEEWDGKDKSDSSSCNASAPANARFLSANESDDGIIEMFGAKSCVTG